MNAIEQTGNPVRFRIEERTPAHVTVRVFIGQEGQGGNAGLLTVRTEEIPLLHEMEAAHAVLKALAEYVAADGYNDRIKEQGQAALAQARGQEPA